MNPQQVIDQLRQTYTGNKFDFDFHASMYLAGDGNKRRRQDIAQILSGDTKPPPLSKCGMYHVADLLRAHFEQLQLF